MPETVTLRDGRTVFLLSLAAVFLVTFVLINVMLYTIVIRRITWLSALADRVSLGDLEAGDFVSQSADEIGILTGALGRMKASLVHVMKVLEP